MVLVVFLTTATVVLVSLVRCVWAIINSEPHRRWWVTNTFLLLASIGCFIALNLIGSYVDKEGGLHEPFALIPIGYLLSFTGILGTLLRITLDSLRVHTSKPKTR